MWWPRRLTLPPHSSKLEDSWSDSYADITGFIRDISSNAPRRLHVFYSEPLLWLYHPSPGRHCENMLQEFCGTFPPRSIPSHQLKNHIIYHAPHPFTLPQLVTQLLCQKGEVLCGAESCSGGRIAHLITTVPGASDIFAGSLVAYQAGVKRDILGCSPKQITDQHIVSPQTAAAMARGALKLFDTASWSVAVTGWAGHYAINEANREANREADDDLLAGTGYAREGDLQATSSTHPDHRNINNNLDPGSPGPVTPDTSTSSGPQSMIGHVCVCVAQRESSTDNKAESYPKYYTVDYYFDPKTPRTLISERSALLALTVVSVTLSGDSTLLDELITQDHHRPKKPSGGFSTRVPLL